MACRGHFFAPRDEHLGPGLQRTFIQSNHDGEQGHSYPSDGWKWQNLRR